MRLSTFSDYSLRVLMYLGAQPDRLATIAEIAAGHGISESHLMKVVHQLGRCGYIETVRGKGGGMRLGRTPQDIVLGEVIRRTESDFTLVECFAANAACRIQGACCLNAILDQALNALFLVLDGYTLADLLVNPQGLIPAIRYSETAGQDELWSSIVLALIGLLFINFMRHTRNNEITAEQVDRTEAEVRKIHAGLELPEVVLVGPRHLRTCHEQFLKHMKGDSIWFNVCLSMYKPLVLFDALLRPAIENPTVSTIQFILDSRQKDVWRETILPKISTCSGHEKVQKPRWCCLEKNISFILADSHVSEGTQALLSFWGEPFMAELSERQSPRFIFHVQKHSELLSHLIELDRCYRRSPVISE